MEHLFLAGAFVAGGMAGWFFARAQYSGELKASAKAVAENRTVEAGLRQELAEARGAIELERIERARLETRLVEAQSSLGEQKALLDSAARQLTETFKAISLDALNQNNQSFIQLADKTMQVVLAEMKGDKAAAKEYRATAEAFAAKWVKEADDGKAFRLTFDKPGTWSQKYNLVWDQILGLNLFPDSVRQKEMAHYRTVVKDFGLPLDSRGTGSKSDWTLWTATLTQNRADFDFIASRVLRFVQETPNRVGFGDWYDTATGKHLFMHSRPVMGGSFLQMLYNGEVWRKWSSRDKAKVGGWAPLPKPLRITPLVPAGDTAPAEWSFTTVKPKAGWEKSGFDDSSWSRGLSGFGTEDTPGAAVKTKWNSGEIWLRREVTLKSGDLKNLRLWLHHDEDVEVYINGVLAYSAVGWTTGYEAFELTPAGRSALKAGVNQVAIKCRQTSGGQYIDLGFVQVS